MSKQISKFNVAVTHGNTKAGNVRYINRKGTTYTRAASNSYVNNPRSQRQMRTRLLMTSRVRLWKYLKDSIEGCFVLNGVRSDYQAWMSLNKKLGVYFTKDESLHGSVCAMPCMVSGDKGLQAIQNTYVAASRQLKTNISLGTLTIDANTTVAAFSAAVLSNNGTSFESGDEIAFISVLQYSWYTTDGLEIPSVTVNNYKVVLSLTDLRLLSNLISLDGFHTLDGCLATANNMPAGCFGYLHTRKVNGTLLSAESALCNANSEYYDEWRTDEVFETAAASYGEIKNLFADPESSNIGSGTEGGGGSAAFNITVQVASGQSEMGSVSGSGSYPAGTNAVLIATPATGYHFVSWNDGNTSASRTVTVSQSATYTATFAADAPTGTVTVTLTSAEPSQGKVQINIGEVGNTATATVQSGAATVIKAIPEAGYTFSKWSDGALQFERTINPTEDTSLTATFEAE